jgi:hypothetical protein
VKTSTLARKTDPVDFQFQRQEGQHSWTSEKEMKATAGSLSKDEAIKDLIGHARILTFMP